MRDSMLLPQLTFWRTLDQYPRALPAFRAMDAGSTGQTLPGAHKYFTFPAGIFTFGVLFFTETLSFFHIHPVE